jgi:hypothetical protein
MGLVPFRDLETGQHKWINTSSRRMRRKYKENYLHLAANFKQAFTKADAGAIELRTDEDYFKKLLGYFKSR